MDSNNSNNNQFGDGPKLGGRMSRSLSSSQSRGSLLATDGTASPLISLSQSLRDARRNADSLILSAQNNAHVRRLKDNLDGLESTIRSKAEAKLRSIIGTGVGGLDDWDLLKRLNSTPQLGNGPRTAQRRQGFHRSASTSNLQSLSSQLLRSEHRRSLQDLTNAANGTPRASSRATRRAVRRSSSAQRVVVRPLSQSSAAAAAMQEQALQLATVDAARSVDAVAQTLRLAPRHALASAQQTMSNCQANLQTLSTLLARNIETLGSGTLLARLRTGEDGSFGLVQQDGPGGRLALSWDLAGLLTPRPLFDDNAMANGGDQLEGGPMGPFQRQAEKRKRRQRRRGHSSLREPGRQIAIVTTASLPWMTGTAVNPLLRAAYLARDGSRKVTLMIPWLAKQDQAIVFPNNVTFETPEQQEQYVRDWVTARTGFASDFKVTFYPGRYAAEKCSILPVGDPTQYIPDSEADVAVLEEPEHLTWYHHGRRWTDKFSHVVGIIHTNYLDYARREEGGQLKEVLLKRFNQVLCGIHCHKVVKLSDAVQPLPRQVTEFVHGVPASFLEVGMARAQAPPDGGPRFSKGAYFLGKVLWAKGYSELVELVAHQQRIAAAASSTTSDTAAAATPAAASAAGGGSSSAMPGSSSSSSGGGSAADGDGNEVAGAAAGPQRVSQPLQVDCYGSGEDLHNVQSESEKRRLGMQFQGARDHLHESLHEYKVFINPSTSDVVATTTAEALAMGKWVVCADLPCNAFFSTFPNCLTYKDPDDFSSKVQYALAHDPAPISSTDCRRLTWEDATERFLDASAIAPKERPGPIAAAASAAAYAAHNALAGMEFVRVQTGAGVNTREAPANVHDYVPSTEDVGGIFDDKRRARETFAKVARSVDTAAGSAAR